MEYNFKEIEQNWRRFWAENKTFKAEENSSKPKYYVLDMFPYPSGAGLHVGHPLGYIASDIFSRYKRLQGFNVLHPMGYDSFGLPAEQYAIQTGQHPKITTDQNIARYRDQLDKIGFSFDWDREVKTSSPEYYKWTQWIFKQLFDCWYNNSTNKAERIAELIAVFEKEGNTTINAVNDCEITFSGAQWKAFSEKEQQQILMNYRLTYLADSWVNWCPALGTVLANDEVVNGVSERGGHPVEQKLMRQWSMRIKAYAERLLTGLDTVDWTDSIKDMQRNWIGKSVGASVKFKVDFDSANLVDFDSAQPTINSENRRLSGAEDGHNEETNKSGLSGVERDSAKEKTNRSGLSRAEQDPANEEGSRSGLSGVETHEIEVFTTRPDTIYGVSFMVLAPEHPLVDVLKTPEYAEAVDAYKKEASLKSERDRQADVKNISGQFIGAHAIHPFTGEKVQIWIGDYVLASYGTGAVMAVPCGDQRDWDFAKHFNIEIKNIFKDIDISEAAYTEKDAVITNSDFLNDLPAKKAIKLAIFEIEKRGIGKGQTNYRLRDAVFSRQRYWGEPFPVYYKDDIPHLVADEHLPITLPEVDKYLPTEDGEPPLARATKEAWGENFHGDRMEFNTMPGWAGSSWYFLRYMDPTNDNEFVSKEKVDYWQNVDLYIGGSEHATGHLLYSRFWTKFLYDLGYIPFEEPFQKMINQGMILGRSSLVCRFNIVLKLENPKDLSQIREKGFSELISMPNDKVESKYCFLKDGLVYVTKSLFEEFRANLISSKPYQVGEDGFSLFELDWENKELIDLQMKLKSYVQDRLGFDNLGIKYIVDIIGTSETHVDISLVDNDQLDIEAFKNSREEYKNAEFILEDDGTYICLHEVEKMSKSKYNVQTPDELVDKFGADTLRMYEMFLGPLEQSKPWDTKGINGVHNFLRKLWRLFFDKDGNKVIENGEPTKDTLKTLHKTIKKISDDLERFSFNTGVSNFMICVNELTEQKCHNASILKELVVLLSPYAPHIAEELWVILGNEAGTVGIQSFPTFNEAFLIEANHSYPVSFNGKMRFKLELPTALTKEEVEKEVLANAQTQKYLEGKAAKKVIVVPGKIVNVVM